MEREENILGKENVGTLIKNFSIPCIISLLVNSLYNVVDQIFIGWGVGYLGNGATNVVFPLTMICLAFALMFGDGASAYLSLKLGQKRKDEASKGVGNGIMLSVIVAVFLCVVILAFLPTLLNLFGCTDVLREYALNYGYIIAIGLPFMMIGTTLNSIIRSDGSPKYAMISMLLGAILNIILDPILIFVFNLGVQGAAIATVFSQIVTFVINVIYLKKFKSIDVEKSIFKLKFDVAKKVTMLGISSFITQMSIVFVIAAENNSLSKYGANTKYGAEIPITVLGIVMKISQILNSVIIGIASGAQPIFGYNYGAKKYDRVRKTLKIVLCFSLMISLFAFILFQTIPDKLISIFGSGDELYMEFACKAFRIYLLFCIFNGVQIPSSIFFQAIGKSGKSAILSLSRQILFLIPSMIILGSILGITGVLFAGPVADGLAFLIAITLLILELKHMKENVNESKTAKEEVKSNDDDNYDVKETNNTNDLVITIAREYGSGGRYIGKIIAEKLNMKLLDKNFIQELAKNTGFNEEYIKENEQKRDALDALNSGYYSTLNSADELFIKESELIKSEAKKGACVIVGRCADFILKDRENVVKVFITSSTDDKVKRVQKYYGIENEKEARKEITRINKLRANHYKYYTDRNWYDSSNYDLCLNSDSLGVEKTAEIICEYVKAKKDNNK